MNRHLQIGIMGSAGSGKTILAHLLSSALGIALIEEGVRPWLAMQGLGSPNNLGWDRQLELQEHYLEAKMQRESAQQAFVSDRTTLDVVVNLLLRRGARDQVPIDLAQRALDYARETYDQVVLLRWKDGPWVIPDGIRREDPEGLKREQDLCASLCERMGLGTRVVNAHPTEAEIDFLLQQLRLDSDCGR